MVAPTVNYHYYPAFVEYPGSTTLRLETARDLMIDICSRWRATVRKRFYALNTGVSTVRALRPAAEALAKRRNSAAVHRSITATQPTERSHQKEEGGTHADEIETSMMLFIAPEDGRYEESREGLSPGRAAD